MKEILSKKAIGERIRNLRVENGLSQAFLADILDLSRSNYSQIEIGNQFPSYFTLHAIARYYSRSYEWLLHGYQAMDAKIAPLVAEVQCKIALKQPAVALDTNGQPVISLVTTDLKAAYTQQLEDPEFIAGLSVMQVPVNTEEGTFRAFTAQYSNLPSSILNGDILIGKHLDNYAKIRLNRLYVIVTVDDIIATRIQATAMTTDALICRNNADQSDFHVKFADVKELWEGTARYTVKLDPMINEIDTHLKRVEHTLKKLENDLLMIRSIKKGIK